MLNKFAPFPWGLQAGGLPAVVFYPPLPGAMTPTTGTPGTSVTMTGSGFGSMTGTIAIHGVAATVTFWSATSVTFTVPAQVSYPDASAVVLTTAQGRVHAGDTFTTTAAGPYAAHFAAASSQSLANTTNDADWTMGAFDITAAAWIKTDSVPATSATILSLWDVNNAANRPFSLFLNNGGTGQARAKFQVMGTTNTIRAGISTIDLNDGLWHLVVGWWDHTAGRASIQVDNGAVVTSAANAITMAAIGPSTIPLRMGALHSAGPTLYFDGALDSVGFWKSAPAGGGILDATQRTALYNAGVGLNFSGLSASLKTNLISWWDCEEATANPRLDSQGTTTMSIVTNAPTQVAGKV